jgi:hypothetical protein
MKLHNQTALQDFDPSHMNIASGSEMSDSLEIESSQLSKETENFGKTSGV